MAATLFLNGCVWTPTLGGTGTWTVSTAVSPYFTPAQCTNPAVVDAQTYQYFAVNGTEYEIGYGVYTVSGTTLTRATILSSSNGGSAVNFSVPPVVRMGVPLSEDTFVYVLNSDTTFYVDVTNGSDSNDGLASGTGRAWQTLQYAFDMMTRVNASGYQVTIKLAAGTYQVTPTGDYTPMMQVYAPNNCSKLIVDGDTTTPSNVVIQVQATAYVRAYVFTDNGNDLPRPVTIQGIKVDSVDSDGDDYVFNFWGTGTNLYVDKIIVGSYFQSVITNWGWPGGCFMAGGDITLTANVNGALFVGNNGKIVLDGVLTVSTSISCTSMFSVAGGGYVETSSFSMANPGNLTCSSTRYTCDDSSFVATSLLTSSKAAGVLGAAPNDRRGKFITLSANTTLYVRTDGSDANDGFTNSAGGAFASFTEAWNFAARHINPNGYTLTIAAGNTGTFGAQVISGDVGVAGGGSVTLDFVSTSVVLDANSSSASLYIGKGAKVSISAGKFQNSSSGRVINPDDAGTKVTLLGGHEFGASTAQHIIVSWGAYANAGSINYTISGGASFHVFTYGGGAVFEAYTGTITLSGTPAFSSAFVGADANSDVLFTSTFSGSATGARYSVYNQSHIECFGSGTSYYPGDSAGTADGATYGLYT